MEDFRRQFLSETVAALESLQRNLQTSAVISDSLKRETFRRLHTIKGTAQTFGFNQASRLAHDLETLLADGGNPPNLLHEGIALLRESLAETPPQISEKFTAQVRAAASRGELMSNAEEANFAELPNEIYSQLSSHEKKLIGAARRGDKILTVLEIGFEAANFAAELIEFRAALNASGEIVATFPSPNFGESGKIGFRFLTIGTEIFENSANVVWSSSPPKSADDLGEVLRRITRHGEEIAVRLGKRIAIEARTDAINFSPAELKIIFEILLHLVRNAVDHAVERAGKIEIVLKETANGRRLSVADDGRGIDLERLKARALEKKIIPSGDLSETDAINLIFQPELSTKSAATEISGRGIGLDAVKHAVERIGGEISVQTGKNCGTTFEIFLPKTESETE